MPTLTDEQLGRHLDTVYDFMIECTDVHMKVHSALMMPIAELAFTCRDLLGWGDRETLELLAGLSERSSEPTRRLGELAMMARGKPHVQAVLERYDSGAEASLRGVDGEFAEAFDAYMHEFGCRAMRYELADASLLRDTLRLPAKGPRASAFPFVQHPARRSRRRSPHPGG